MILQMDVRYQFYRFKYNYAKLLRLKKPVDISLELASACNMRCAYCYHANQNNLPFDVGFMSESTAFEILNQAADLGVNSVKFNWRGEGTLNPNYKNILCCAEALAKGSTFIDRIVNSNFQFRNSREDIFEALCTATKVKVSYDSNYRKVFEAQRIKGDHRLISQNIDTFYNHPKRKNTKLIIQAVRTKLNKGEDIEYLIKKRWPEAEISIRDMVEGRVDNNLDDLNFKKREELNRMPCKQAYARLIFNHKGEAMPCCPDIKEQIKFGSIHDMHLYDIFNTYRAQKLRRELKNGVAFLKDPCKSCSSFESYGNYVGKWDS
jgi:radical SAM protein with 4Fe4S-binding SPASM domain